MPRYPEATPETMHYAQPHGFQRVLMTPAQFLKQAPFLALDEESEEAIAGLCEHILDGKPLDALMLGRGRAHDGRHRAHAAARCGVKLVPVYLEDLLNVTPETLK